VYLPNIYITTYPGPSPGTQGATTHNVCGLSEGFSIALVERVCRKIDIMQRTYDKFV